jgi:hypothetical protein
MMIKIGEAAMPLVHNLIKIAGLALLLQSATFSTKALQSSALACAGLNKQHNLAMHCQHAAIKCR